jgi:uncharacterized protein (DUF427 family)
MESARLPRPEPEAIEGTAPNGLPYESVWSYPRPPEIRPEPRPVSVSIGGESIGFSERALRVCETSGAPVIYLPADDLTLEALRPAAGKTLCEFKGTASYRDVVAAGHEIPRAAWTYRRPTRHYEQLADHYSFYPALLECRLGDERVSPQPGRFYGGWVTAEITGPIKGEPGSEGW